MPEIDPIKELGRKLLRQGVPRRHATGERLLLSTQGFHLGSQQRNLA